MKKIYRVNGKPISMYHANVVSFDYQPLSFTKEVYYSDTNVEGVEIYTDIKPKSMTLVLDFHRMIDISRFTAEILKGLVLDIADGYQYHCRIQNTSGICTQEAEGFYTVSYPLDVMQKGILMKTKLEHLENYILVKGTLQAPCRFQIKALKNLDQFTIDSHVIKQIPAGSVIDFDGMKKKVFMDDLNKFQDVILHDHKFPSLTPGMQKIKMSTTDVEVFLEYYPIYI